LIDTLFKLRKEQEKLDAEAESLRTQISTKEAIIKMKEDEKGNLKSTIENEKNEQEEDFDKLRAQLDEQKDMIKKQRNLLNHLQVLNEINQGDMTITGTELSKVEQKREQLAMKINEQVHD